MLRFLRFFKAVLATLLAIMPVPVSSAGEESVQHPVPLVVKAMGEIAPGVAVATPLLGSRLTKAVRRDLDPSGAATVELAPGRWLIEIESPGYWSESTTLQVEEVGGPVELRVLPAARVSGRLSLPRGETAPGALRGEFRLAASKSADPGIEKGSSTCPVGEDLAFECVLPAGMMDIGLRARSFVPIWLWDRTLRRGSTMDLGTIKLRRGSSVSGWIEVAEGPGDPRDAVLHLEALSLPGAGSSAEERDRQLLRLETRANQRGHFAFEVVPPGSYGLSVELVGYAPVRRAGIPVLLDSESVIGEPLELFRSRKLEMRVEPAVDPKGREWTVQLRVFENADAEPLQAVAKEGTAVLDSVVPGHYSVLVTDGEGIRRWWREVEVEPGQEELTIFVETFSVRGRVLFGREGIPAELIFGGSSGAVSIPAKADDEGEFEVDLPRGGTWPVDVRSAAVEGRKWLRLQRGKPGGEPARVEVVFPNNELAGRVVDILGAPVAGADILLFAAPEIRAERSAADGGFVFRGVEAGDAVLAARLDPDRGSEEQRIHVRATGRIEGIELILLDRVRLSGAVEASTGGVPGSLVVALPETATGLGVLPEQAFTGRDGFFELSVPAAATQLRVAILAPGFPLQVLQVPAEPKAPLLLPVGGEGGELVLRPGLDESSFAPGSVLVSHEGFPLDAEILASWARRNGSRASGDEMRVPRLSAGMYTICTDIEPRTFLRVLTSGSAQAGDCRRVRVHEGEATVVDLRQSGE